MNHLRGKFMSPQALAALNMYEGVASSSVTQMNKTDQHQMVRVLLEGAIQRIKEANAALNLSDFEKKSSNVTKAQKIIFGLRKTLDFDKGGEIAMNLDSLYDYCIRMLTSAHCRNNGAKFEEVQKILEELLSGWKQIK
jgi:flagellar protein FliS